MQAIATIGLSHKFSAEAVLDDVNLAVPAGSIYGFLGPNGAGKTTTLRLVLGLLRVQHGTIEVLGRSLDRHRLEILSRIGEVLSHVGLAGTGSKRADQFSLGMKQRLAIAVALLHEPALLILDEPANGLDPHGILEMRALLTALNRDHGDRKSTR